MYVLDEAIAYPPKLHISRCTDIKMVSDRVCPRLPICNEGKKKGFKLYFNEKEAKQRVDATTWCTTVVKRKVESEVEESKMDESTLVIIVEKPKAKGDEAPIESTSHEDTSKEATTIIFHTISSGSTPINFAPPEIVTKIKVKKIIGLAMNSFIEKQMVENEKFRYTMQQVIATW